MPDNSEGTYNALLSLLGKATESNDTPPPEQPSSGGDILTSLLSNPEIISKLPQIMSMVKPLMDSMSSQNTQAASIPTALANTQHAHKSPDNRSALLCAMKPYLGPERQQAIDYMMKLSKLGDVLKSL